MSTNAPTRRIMYMHCHMFILSPKVILFFFQRNTLIESFQFFQKIISFLLFFKLLFIFISCFTLSIIFQFVIPIFFIYIYEKNNSWVIWLDFWVFFNQFEKANLNSFKKFFQFLSDLFARILREKSSPQPTSVFFFFFVIYIYKA